MHPPLNTNFDTRISIFHLDLHPTLTDYCGKGIQSHALILTGIVATGTYYTHLDYRDTKLSGYLFTWLSCSVRK